MNKQNTIMSADLGLFNQLLQMVDGDWSDSIQGICNHIQDRFKALGVFLSVYDKKFNEFIYVSSAFEANTLAKLTTNEIELNQEVLLSTFKRVIDADKTVLDNKIFRDDTLLKLADTFFNGDESLSKKILSEVGVKSLFAIPVLSDNEKYICSFHIITERQDIDYEENLIKEYLYQLNVALEIVFLVRELYIKATHDSLTRLFNHKQGIILLSKEIDRVKRNKQPLSVAMVDIDYFKKINDLYGHRAGDLVLEHVSTFLSNTLRKCDVISRYGGEEFLIVLPDTSLEKSYEVMNRIKIAISKKVFTHNSDEFSVTASFGLVDFNDKVHKSAEGLIEIADQRLYLAKKQGRDCICCES